MTLSKIHGLVLKIHADLHLGDPGFRWKGVDRLGRIIIYFLIFRFFYWT
jgi:hypothetical protein